MLHQMILLAALLTLSGTGPEASPALVTDLPPWLQGSWSGLGYQIDGQEWPVFLQAEADAKQAYVSYPSLACSGTWTLAQWDHQRGVGEERMLKGVSNCDQGVTLSLQRLSAHQIRVVFYLRWYSDDPLAWAVLTREPEA